MDMKENLKNEAKSFLEKVDESNFYESCLPFIDVLIKYRSLFNKKEILAIITELNEELQTTPCQEEVIFEVGNRIYGHCTFSKIIDW
jgi:hypothetical protein